MNTADNDPLHAAINAGLANIVKALADEGGSGTLGSRYRAEEGCWKVLIFPKPVELVGGADDGEIVAPGFSLDLDGLRSLFERVDDFSWQALGLNPKPRQDR
jgi:hypothetical protein